MRDSKKLSSLMESGTCRAALLALAALRVEDTQKGSAVAKDSLTYDIGVGWKLWTFRTGSPPT